MENIFCGFIVRPSDVYEELNNVLVYFAFLWFGLKEESLEESVKDKAKVQLM